MTFNLDKTGITAIWGGRGSGKTTFAKEKVAPVVKSQRLIVIDPMASDGLMNARAFAQALYDGERRVTLATGNPDQVIPALYAAYAHSTKTDPIYAICDEAPAYLARNTPGMDKIMFQGRHRAFGMCLIGQRMSAVSAQIRSQAGTTIYMRLNDHVDIETAKKAIGPRASELSGFKPGQYIQHPE